MIWYFYGWNYNFTTIIFIVTLNVIFLLKTITLLPVCPKLKIIVQVVFISEKDDCNVLVTYNAWARTKCLEGCITGSPRMEIAELVGKRHHGHKSSNQDDWRRLGVITATHVKTWHQYMHTQSCFLFFLFDYVHKKNPHINLSWHGGMYTG